MARVVVRGMAVVCVLLSPGERVRGWYLAESRGMMRTQEWGGAAGMPEAQQWLESSGKCLDKSPPLPMIHTSQ